MNVYVITQACVDATFDDEFVGVVFSTVDKAKRYIESHKHESSQKLYYVMVEVDNESGGTII